MTIQIRLNGETREVPTDFNLARLLKELQLNPQQVAIAKNWEVFIRSELAHTPVTEGDEIEIFHAVGGG